MEPTDKKNILDITEFSKQLIDAGIDISTWGKGEAKTVEHLKGEVERGESILEEDDTGTLMRKLSIVGANIYYTSPDGKKYRLKEDRQIFKEGRERRRGYGHSVSEKMKPEEDPRDAMIRGIQEELGISSEISPLEIFEDEKIIISSSYPGLLSNYKRYGFEVILNDEQFNPDGYVEEQEKLNTYFVWEEIE